MSFLGPASLLPLITDEYGISKATGGFLVTSMTLVMTFASIPTSVMMARWNLRRSYALGWYLLGVGALVPFFPSLVTVIGLRMVQGLGAAVLMPLAASVVMRWAPVKEIPVVNALNLASLTAGIGLALVMGPLLADWVGWAWVLGIEGAMALVGATLWLLLAHEPDQEKSADGAVPPVRLSDIVQVFRMRSTWILAIAVVGPWAQFITLSTWLPTFYTDVRGLDLGVAGVTASIFTFVGIPATILGGIITTRMGRRRPILIWTGLFLGTAGAATVLAPAGILIYVAVIVTGFLQWMYEPALFTLPLELPNSSPERAGAIWAAILTMGNASSFIAPIVVGFMTDLSGSFIPGFLLVAVTCFSILAAGLLLPETGPGRRGVIAISSPD